MDDGRPPKKAYTHTKTRVKPPPMKVMVKRDANDEISEEKESPSKFQTVTVNSPSKVSLLDEEEEEEEANENDENNDEDVQMPLVRTKRYVNVPHSGKSPHSVSNAANYNEEENKGWVKPLYSSIVYRLPVHIAFVFDNCSCFSFTFVLSLNKQLLF